MLEPLPQNKSCRFFLHNISQIHPRLSISLHCYYLSPGLHSISHGSGNKQSPNGLNTIPLAPPQSIFPTETREIISKCPLGFVTPLLENIKWFPIAFRIRFKIPSLVPKPCMIWPQAHLCLSPPFWEEHHLAGQLLAILRSQINCLIHNREPLSSWIRSGALPSLVLPSQHFILFPGTYHNGSAFVYLLVLMPVVLPPLPQQSPIQSELHEYCNLVYFAYSCNSSRELNTSIQQAFRSY